MPCLLLLLLPLALLSIFLALSLVDVRLILICRPALVGSSQSHKLLPFEGQVPLLKNVRLLSVECVTRSQRRDSHLSRVCRERECVCAGVQQVVWRIENSQEIARHVLAFAFSAIFTIFSANMQPRLAINHRVKLVRVVTKKNVCFRHC